MKNLMSTKIDGSVIKGNLDVHFVEETEVVDGIPSRSFEILIHGDPDGLRSFANMLLEIANYDQELDSTLPVGARHHVTLNPSLDLSKNSHTTTIGRLDAKQTGGFYARFQARR